MRHVGITIATAGAAIVHVDHGDEGAVVTEIERLPFDLAAVADRVRELDEGLPDVQFVVDSEGVGGALWQALGPPEDEDRWQVYLGRGVERQALVNHLLVAIEAGRFHFAAGLAEQVAMSKAIVTYRREVREDGLIGSELVVALLLALVPPKPAFAAGVAFASPGHDARRVTAYHEAGHAVASWLLGRPLTLVSIRRGRGFGGITMEEKGDTRWVDSFDPGLPTLLQSIDTRTAIERSIVMALAGPIAGGYASQSSGYHAADPCEVDAERAAAGLAELSPRHRELLAVEEHADPTEFEPDEHRAAGMSHALVGTDHEAAAHLRWLTVVATNLVTDRWYRIAALAAVLLERTVVDGATAASIIAAARRETAHA